MQTDFTADQVTIQELGPVRVAVFEHRGDRRDIEATITRLIEWRKASGLSPKTNPTFNIWHSERNGPGGSMSRDFEAPGVRWQVAKVGEVPIGYAKLTPLRAPASDPEPGAMEMQQLYVAHEWHGTGVADRLAAWSLAAAREAGATEIYLTVFDHNERAKRFYDRHGFSEVGRCTFQLGDRIDDDRIWRARLVG